MKSKLIALLLAIVVPLMGIPTTINCQAENTLRGDKVLKLWYDEEVSQDHTGWMNNSIPIGNGYMGANIFGGTSSELISITENSMFNPATFSSTSVTGLNLLAKTYIDFGHTSVSDYKRELTLNDAISTVSYSYNGVNYKREYFTSYPNAVMVMKFTADKAGELNFTLRPEVPFVCDYLVNEGDGCGKTGIAVADTTTKDLITLSGTMDYYYLNFEAQYKVIPQGSNASLSAANTGATDGTGATITVADADSAIIILAVGTNYDYDDVTFTPQGGDTKLDGTKYPHEKVSEYIANAEIKGYDTLLNEHLEDYQGLFSRVSLDLGGSFSDSITTDKLIANYKAGDNDPYLEELVFQYGRYLLISSSREGCLPPNLQGIWNFDDCAPYTGGYWHNINIQMNYWPAFSTNLAETFESYIDFYNAYTDDVSQSASNVIAKKHPENYDVNGNNGWSIGTGSSPYRAYSASGNSIDGYSTGALMCEVFWDYYQFTQDKIILEDTVYPAIYGSANFLSRTMHKTTDGLYLTTGSGSPENHVSFSPIGPAWDQQLAYSNYSHTLTAAEILNKNIKTDEVLSKISEQIDKLDPVIVGASGQVKEFREETVYGEFGEYTHRHISQLVGLYPGTVINSTTPAWLDAAKYSLTERGDESTGWALAHRLNAWARLKDGDHAYLIYKNYLSKRLLNNLWSTHPPFQIDGSFGVTAGVSEMLLQSHEGYIEPLAALTSDWESGSYSGLVARGNFEVGAKWANSLATEFTVKSNAGGVCKLKYNNLSSAIVKNSKGEIVDFTVISDDLISFDTAAGETYTVTNIPEFKNISAPTNVNVFNTATGDARITWDEVNGADTYSIYVAKQSQPDYTLLASNLTECSYTAVDAADLDNQYVYCVTANSNDGIVSPRSTYLMSTAGEITDANAYFLDDGTLQISISSTANEPNYAIYATEADGIEKMIFDTKYNNCVIENASKTATYTVGVKSGDLCDEARYPITINYDTNSPIPVGNVFLNKNITLGPDDAGHGTGVSSNYLISKMVDGDLTTRYAGKDMSGKLQFVIDISDTYMLRNIKIVEFNDSTPTRSDETTIEVSTDGGTTYKTIIDKASLSTAEDNDGNGLTYSTVFDLNDSPANMVRVTMNNTVGSDLAKSPTIYEVSCEAYSQGGEFPNRLLLQNSLMAADAVDTQGCDVSALTTFKDYYNNAVNVMNNSAASMDDIDTAQKNLDNAIKMLSYTEITNIAVGKCVTVLDANYSYYNLDKINDGDRSNETNGSQTRYYRFYGNDTGNTVKLEFDLKETYAVFGINIVEYNEGTTRCGDTTIEFYDGESWTTVVSGASLTAKGNMNNVPLFGALTNFTFDGCSAQKVRFTFINTVATKHPSFYEIEILGMEPPTAVTGITLDKTELILDEKQTATLNAIITPNDATNETVVWKSSDMSVARVEKGVVTALKCGTALISVTTIDGNYSAVCKVTVNEVIKPYADNFEIKQLVVDCKEDTKIIKAYISNNYLECFSDFSLTFEVDGIETNVTDYECINDDLVFEFTSLANGKLNCTLNASYIDNTMYIANISANLARFNEVGSKYTVFSSLTIGDVNNDGKTNVKDLVFSKKLLAGLVDTSDSSDVSGDGSFNNADIVCLSKYIISAKNGIKTHTVNFYDFDNKIFQTINVLNGFGANPNKPSVPNGYVFNGWDKVFDSVTEDLDVKALFIETDDLHVTVPDWPYDD